MLTPTSRSSLNLQSQKILHRLDHPPTLSVSLRMKGCTETEIRTEQVEQRFPELADKMGIPIRDYHFWETV